MYALFTLWYIKFGLPGQLSRVLCELKHWSSATWLKKYVSGHR